MPEDQSRIYLILNDHQIDATKARLYPPPGIVVVEMLPETKQIGSIFLPDTVAGRLRPDVAIVLAVGPDISLPVGAMVTVRPYDGEWIEGFDVPGYKTNNQVRMVGRYSQTFGEVETIAWDETIPVQILPDTLDMVATGKNIIIRREPIVSHESGFDLPDAAKYWTGLADVLSIGPDCDLMTRVGPVRVGDRIHYNQKGLLDFGFGDDDNLAIISDVSVNLLITPQVAA